MIKIILPMLILALVITSGCTQPSIQSDKTQTNTIIIKNFAFEPSTLTVKSGTTVTWINKDDALHKVASDPHPAHTDLPELVSEDLSKGQNYSFTFTKTDTFGYHCHLHPTMKGTIIVE